MTGAILKQEEFTVSSAAHDLLSPEFKDEIALRVRSK